MKKLFSERVLVEKMKRLFSTRALVGTAIGAALFTLAFMYIKLPSPIPSTQIQTAYAISALFGVIFGPVSAGLMAFIGHALNDIILWGSAWWSWIIASGIGALICGISYFFLDVENGKFDLKGIVVFNLFQVLGHIVAWVAVAPVLDIVIYKEPLSVVFAQSAFAVISNSLTTGVIGTLLIFAYSKTRTGENSLSKK